ncbi:BlaI/MecI/CopY family transcriptional regulator [Prevotella sp. 10(H)]|uniref:BlaI/MecI/CopY family transcriptional regulator n=1 Tax=Prevotella sp. 10(H) TaxID=1158294 RepID=UPI0004A6D158|nr:BlaI/MecI/CopY family transcriptional regulator [Prevotella sp. 10(H)]
MKALTNKEEEIMEFFWQHGSMFVKDIQKLFDEPKPHINTISTMIRILEEKGFAGHESLGKTYRYHALISKDEYRKKTLKGVISKYFNNCYLDVVSSFITKEDVSIEELKSLIDQVEQAHIK